MTVVCLLVSHMMLFAVFKLYSSRLKNASINTEKHWVLLLRICHFIGLLNSNGFSDSTHVSYMDMRLKKMHQIVLCIFYSSHTSYTQLSER